MREPGLDWQSLVLDAADVRARRTLIEASAGTGKTWTISVLYLRLVLERGLRASQIAVTTFTDAAAQELRERVRARLHWALTIATTTDAPAHVEDDPDVRSWLARRWIAGADVQVQDALRLRLALAELDIAPISTIHGLCRKILADQPFASGSEFRPGEMVAESDLIEEIADDLIRTCAHAPGDVLDQAATAALFASDSQRAEAVRVLKLALSPAIKVLGPDAVQLRADLETLGRHDAGLAALADHRAYFRGNSVKLASALRALSRASEDASSLLVAFAALEVIAKPVSGHILKDHLDTVTANPAFQAALRFARQYEALAACLHMLPILSRIDLLKAWRRTRLAERNQLTFDELIERVYQATHDPVSGCGLADRLFDAWPVALIDEFQDTDARQYGIFDAIYRDRGHGLRGLLVMIGDPKQAIYSFRGGDIQAYLRAARTVGQRMSLSANFRSSSGMIAAMNVLYAAAPAAFGGADAAITYWPVTASGRADTTPLSAPALLSGAALQFHRLPAPAPGDAPAEERALAACADLIVSYLRPSLATLGDEPVAPGNIAVLLPRRKHIGQMRDRLQRLGVPCAGVGNDTIFDSEWARDLRVVLHALLHVSDAGALRAALATRLLGRGRDEMRALDEHLAEWRHATQLLASLAARWRTQGVLAVVNRLIEQAAARLLTRPDGERALTDLRHLGELLQMQNERLPGPEALLAWLADQCERDEQGDEQASKERELRIESDQRRVQLLTLHSSKGLEFDIVMLPLLWKHDVIRKPPKFGASSDRDDGQRVLDLGSAAFEAHVTSLQREQQHERMRVLYVALTRARHACHVTLPPEARKSARTAAGAPAQVKVNASGLEHFLAGVDLAALAADCPDLRVLDSPVAGDCVHEPSRRNLPVRRALSFERVLPVVGLHSFSTLLRQRKAIATDDDGAAHDENDMPADLGDSGLAGPGDDAQSARPHAALVALFALRGAKFGNALHLMFEQRDPTIPLRAQRALVRSQLVAEGVRVPEDEVLIDALAARIDATLAADLGGGATLHGLAPEQQRAEMSFNFLLSKLRLGALEQICAAHGHADLVPAGLHHRELRGYMNGKIDLVFEHAGRVHVLDYKSNWLGDTLADYAGPALDAAMREHAYEFQALLYTLAVDRYLQQRKPGYDRARHLGDAIYLFVRAVGLDHAAGIWRQRFAPAFIAELQALFALAADSVPT